MTNAYERNAYERNAYERFAEATLPRRKPRLQPRIIQRESQAPRALLGLEKEIAEANAQYRRYLRWKAFEVKQLLDGECGTEIRELKALLHELRPSDVQRFLAFMEQHGWFQHLDQHARQVILGMVGEAIYRMRIREGLSPIDDSLPGEEPTIFEICRAKLEVSS